ncbi:MAG: glycosyltransferase family 39 protein [Candidatus Omnitrophota bacterium]
MNRKTVISYVIVLIAVSLLLRAFLLDLFLSRHSIEQWEYDSIARNILAGKGFTMPHLGTTYRSFTTPLYVFLLVLVYGMFGFDPAPVMYMQTLLSIGACVLIFLIARKTFDEKAALVALALTIFHPALVLYSVKKAHTLTLDLFVFSLVIFCVMKLRERVSLKSAAFCGLTFGVAALSRFSIMDFLPFVLLWLFILMKGGLLKKVSCLAIFLIFLSVPVSGWVLRNYVIHHKFIPGASVDAEVFWRGNNMNATGSSYMPSGEPVLLEDKELYSKIVALPELEQREIFREEALKFVSEDPARFIMLFFRKLGYFWWSSPTTGLLYPSLYTAVYNYSYAFYVLFAAAGLYMALGNKVWSDKGNLMLLVLFMLSISVFQSLFYVEGRHRWSVEPVLLIISASGITGLFEIFSNFYKRER